jgi:hypothetical protein
MMRRRPDHPISKHLEVLERSGVVVRRVEERTHRLALNLDSLGETIDGESRLSHAGGWQASFDNLARVLE